MSCTLPDSELERLGEFVAKRMGLHFPPSRWRDLQRGMERAASELGFKDAAHYTSWVLDRKLEGADLEALAAHLTVSETYFFRDRGLFSELEHTLLPNLIKKRRAQYKRLRIWCAGCCTGEEAYSVAVLLHRLIPDLPAWNVSLLATDINARSLKKAQAGVYGPWSFRDATQPGEAYYFSKHSANETSVHADIRSLVTFSYLNLAEDVYPSLLNNTNALDLIVCRNVLMYLEPRLVHAILSKFSAALVEDGMLVVAPSELSMMPPGLFTTEHYANCILLRKAESITAPRPRGAGAGMAPVPEPQPRSSAREVQGAYLKQVPPRVAPRSKRSFPSHTVTPDLAEAESLYQQHRYADAHTLTEQWLHVHPRDAAAMRLMARVCANEGRLDAALNWCDQAVAHERVNPSGYFLRAQVLQERGHTAEASEALRQTLYLQPEFIIANFTMGALSWANGNTRDAHRHWRNTTRLLAKCGPDEIVPESDGLSAARLGAIILSIIGEEALL